MNLQGKRILLGVTGSIAAYKSAILVRLLIKSGAEVRVVMTPSALDFITPLTLATLSKHPVFSEFIEDSSGQWNNHVELGLWADVFVIAPASANTLAKIANGLCDNLLMATYLSAKCPVFVAPAMDLDMLKHPSTINNMRRIKEFGNVIVSPAFGELASGLVGDGRMEEPETIFQQLVDYFDSNKRLKGKHVLVTSGPTYEPIDPVRFIGNHSTGKMGFALAEAAANEGAAVTLVTGPTALHTENPMINVIKVMSAEEMYNSCIQIFSSCDITILAAAVADYKPKVVAENKIKKQDDDMLILLDRTKDIASELGKQKRNGQVTVGFALETDNEQSNAIKKLESKNLDFIVLNSLRDKGAGFGHDTNKIRIINRDQTVKEFDLKSKKEVANDIVNAIVEKLSHH